MDPAGVKIEDHEVPDYQPPSIFVLLNRLLTLGCDMYVNTCSRSTICCWR